MNRKILGGALLSLLLCFSPAEARVLTLGECVDMALEESYELDAAAADEEQAKWALSEARRATGPQLGYQAAAKGIGGEYYTKQAYSAAQRAYYRLREKDAPAYHASYQNTFSLSYPLYTGGRNEANIDYAELNLEASHLSYLRSKEELVYQVTALYYEALERKSLTRVHERSKEVLSEHLRIVEANFEEGTIAKADVLASEVQLANASQSLNSAENDYENALARLKNALTLPQSEEIILDESLPAVALPPEYATEAFALAHRCDLEASRLTLAAAREQVKAARADYYPQVSAGAAKSIDGEHPGEHNHTEQWEAGVNVSWNVFDNGVTAARVNEARAAEKKAEAALHSKEAQVSMETRVALNDLSSALKNIETTEKAVAQAEEDYRIAQVRYLEGVDTNLAVMDAQEKLTEAETNYYTALYKYHTSRAELAQALGVEREEA